MLFGPTPDQSLLNLIGPTSGSRGLLQGMSRFTGPQGFGYVGHAPYGFGNSVLAFLNRPPLPPPVFLGAQASSAQAPLTSSAGAPVPATGPNINASTGTGDVGEAEAEAEAAEEARNAEEIKKTSEKYRNADHGYTQEEIDAIIKEAKEASGGDAAKFNRIMKALPSKKFKEPTQDADDSIEAQKQAWTRDFGKWHAEHIGGLKPSKAEQLVNDVASEGEATYKLTYKPKGPNGYKHYEVTKVDGTGSLKKGDSVYYKDGAWYRDAAGTKLLAKASGTPGQNVELKVDGRSDYMSLTPYGVMVYPNENGSKDVYDRYIVNTPSGTQSTNITDAIKPDSKKKVKYIYFKKDDNTWHYKTEKDGKDFIEPLKAVEHIDGRLYFDRGGHSYDISQADDAVGYMGDLKEARDEYVARIDNVSAEEKKQKTARTNEVTKIFEDSLKKDAVNKLKYDYDAENNVLNITCDKKDCETVWKAMGGGSEKSDESDKTNEKLFKQFPDGMKFTFNGEKLRAGNSPFRSLKDAIHRGITAEETPKADSKKKAADVKADVKPEQASKKLDTEYSSNKVSARAKKFQQDMDTAKTKEDEKKVLDEFNKYIDAYEAAIHDLENADPDGKFEEQIKVHKDRMKSLRELVGDPGASLEELKLAKASPDKSDASPPAPAPAKDKDKAPTTTPASYTPTGGYSFADSKISVNPQEAEEKAQKVKEELDSTIADLRALAFELDQAAKDVKRTWSGSSKENYDKASEKAHELLGQYGKLVEKLSKLNRKVHEECSWDTELKNNASNALALYKPYVVYYELYINNPGQRPLPVWKQPPSSKEIQV